MIHVINWFVNILTLGLVSIATITTTTYHVDEPIPELNNLSLTQVFEGGQLVVNPEFNDGTSGWTPLFATGSVTDGIYSLTGNGSNIATRMQYTPKTINNNDKVYAVTKLKYITSGLNYFQFSLRDGATPRSPFIEFFNIQQNVWNDFSAIITANATSSNMSVYLANVYFDTASANGGVVQYDYVYAINLTSLGIDLTKEQMDYWFSIYQQAVANNGVYIESNAHLNNNIHLVDVSVMVISFGLWTWLYKFLKGVVL